MKRRHGLSLGLCALLLLGPGLSPVSGQSRRAGSRQSRTSGPRGADTAVAELVTLDGTLRAVGKKQIELVLEGDQSLALRRTSKTKFFLGKKEVSATGIPLGSAVTAEVKRELNGDLLAVNVRHTPKEAGVEQRK
ncbi:MAG: hypothetical protein HYR60_00260 [Acidobacteria bacterium]|nr:hypothetical protein [Acidobacteriota bacterium]